MSSSVNTQTSILQKKERIKYFDLLKGMAIFLVVMGHVLTMCVRGIDSAFIFKLISEVHMPIFFFISGYLTYKIGFKRPDLKKRFKQLVIPFFVVSALWVLYFPHSKLCSPLSDNIIGLYCSYWKDGYWFTLCLFEMFLIYWPLSILLDKIKSFKWELATIISVYIILIVLSNFLSFPDENIDIIGLGLLTNFFPVFMMGLMANRYKEEFAKITSGNYWFIIGVIIFAFSWYFLSYFWEFPAIPECAKLIVRPIEHMGLMIVVVTAIIPWSNDEFRDGNKPSKVATYFNYLGQESLAIYLLHYFFLFPLTSLQEPLKELGLSFVPLAVLAIAVAFCVVAVTLLVNYLVQKNKILSLLLIGK